MKGRRIERVQAMHVNDKDTDQMRYVGYSCSCEQFCRVNRQTSNTRAKRRRRGEKKTQKTVDGRKAQTDNERRTHRKQQRATRVNEYVCFEFEQFRGEWVRYSRQASTGWVTRRSVQFCFGFGCERLSPHFGGGSASQKRHRCAYLVETRAERRRLRLPRDAGGRTVPRDAARASDGCRRSPHTEHWTRSSSHIL